jgi:hypothetical protein
MDAQVGESLHESLPLTASTERDSMTARDPAPETPKMAHDSLVTVRLSEPDPIVLDSPLANSVADTDQTTPTKDPADDLVEIPVSPLSPKHSLLDDDKEESINSKHATADPHNTDVTRRAG